MCNTYLLCLISLFFVHYPYIHCSPLSSLSQLPLVDVNIAPLPIDHVHYLPMTVVSLGELSTPFRIYRLADDDDDDDDGDSDDGSMLAVRQRGNHFMCCDRYQEQAQAQDQRRELRSA